MNAIQMAIASGIESAIKGLQSRIPELLSNLPPEVMQNIGQIGATVAGFKSQLDRIENQNRMIMDHLGIAEIPQPLELENHVGRTEN